MTLLVQVISQHPPGGRCTLYAAYAEVLARHLDADARVVVSKQRDAHGDGYPSLWLNGAALQPNDGVILMPADLLAGLQSHGVSLDAMMGLAEALEAPLERMLEEEG